MVGLVWLTFGFAGWYGLVGLLVIIASGVLAQVLFLPRADSRHFVMSIFGSISRLYADYERDKDEQRAYAMRSLLDRFVLHYDEVVAKGDKP